MHNEKIILDKYNKKYILPVYSGTLAIEGVLKSLNLKNTDKVLITNVVCFSILEAILNANLTPVIAIPKNGLVLSKEEIFHIVKKEKIKVFIAVHQYGYEQEIVKIKDLIVIEDISQAWNIKLSDSFVGKNSDYIITSLGKNKPLNNNIGGLIISDIDFISNFDTKEKKCRNYSNKIIEYYYPLSINYKKIVMNANRIVINQRSNAAKFKKIFQKYDFITVIDVLNSIPSYHRYLIYVKDNYYDSIIGILEKCNINFQKEYKHKLDKINLVKFNNIKVIGAKSSNCLGKCLLLKTNNKYLNIKRFELEMRRYYES